ncbi:MAG: hypothetical protein MZV64_09055 [Ignavibacteriales bacterium]|nr:hypothetical protein [Ignavibacteriales bacterium]
MKEYEKILFPQQKHQARLQVLMIGLTAPKPKLKSIRIVKNLYLALN